MVEVEGCTGHDPVRVVDDLETDEAGRPARWLWHLECYGCGEILEVDETQTLAVLR